MRKSAAAATCVSGVTHVVVSGCVVGADTLASLPASSRSTVLAQGCTEGTHCRQRRTRTTVRTDSTANTKTARSRRWLGGRLLRTWRCTRTRTSAHPEAVSDRDRKRHASIDDTAAPRPYRSAAGDSGRRRRAAPFHGQDDGPGAFVQPPDDVPGVGLGLRFCYLRVLLETHVSATHRQPHTQ